MEKLRYSHLAIQQCHSAPDASPLYTSLLLFPSEHALSLSLFFFVEALPTIHILFFLGCAWSLLWHAGYSLQSAGFSTDLRAPELTESVAVVCGAL